MLFLFNSCVKNSENAIKTPTISGKIDIMSNYIMEVFDSAYTKYPMQVFCNCDCNSFSVGQNIVHSILWKYPEFNSFPFDSINCQQYADVYGNLCSYSNEQIDSTINSNLGELVSLDVIDLNTRYFIRNALNIIYTRPNLNTYDSLRSVALSLPNSTNNYNVETALSIISNSRLAYFTFNKYDFPGGHIQGWVHKVAAGCAKAMFDIVKGTVNGDFPPVTGGPKYIQTLGWGFAEGFLLSF